MLKQAIILVELIRVVAYLKKIILLNTLNQVKVNDTYIYMYVYHYRPIDW